MTRIAHHAFQIPVLALSRRGSIDTALQGPVLIVTAWAVIVWLSHRLGLMPDVGQEGGSLLGVISGVTGLLVAFRSNSSYERWSEGRRIWADIQANSRTLMRLLALSLPPPAARGDRVQAQAAQETLAMIPAFAHALKHHLRDERAVDSADVKALLTPAVLQQLSVKPGRKQELPGDHASLAAIDAERELSVLNDKSDAALATRASPSYVSTNIPLAIVGQLHATLNIFHTSPMSSLNSPNSENVALDTATWANCLNLLNNLTGCVTNCERIRDTPIPASMAIHMQRLIALFVFAVPLQLVHLQGFWSIPLAALAAFVYYGIDAISQELSDPFGTEPNDLPVAKFCSDIHREYRELVGEDAASLAGADVESRVKSD